MGRGLLAGVCACAMASQVFGAAYQFEGGRYEQKFEGLSWTSSGGATSATNFGSSTNGTEGWIAGKTSHVSTYTYRRTTTSTPYAPGGYSGAPMISSAVTDRSYMQVPEGTANTFVSLYLYNGTADTFDSAAISYTAELWLKPGKVLTETYRPKLNVRVGVPPGSLKPFPDFGTPVLLDTYYFVTTNKQGDELSRNADASGLDWDPGETLALTWTMPSGMLAAGHFYGLDDIVVAVPEPSVVLMGSGLVLAALAVRRRAARGGVA